MPSCIAQALTKCRCPLEPDSSPRISQEIRATRVGMYRPLAFDAVGAGCPDDQKGTGNSRPCRRTLPTAPAGRPQPREIQWNGNARNPSKRDHAISSRRKPAKFLLSEICHQRIPLAHHCAVPCSWGTLGVVGSQGGAVAPSERQRALFRMTGAARAKKKGCEKK